MSAAGKGYRNGRSIGNEDSANGITIPALTLRDERKRKKRAREELVEDNDTSTDATSRKRKKKKKPRKDSGDGGLAEPLTVHESIGGGSTSQVREPHPQTPQPSDYMGNPNIQIDPALLPPSEPTGYTSSSQMQTAALISALAATASSLNPSSTHLQSGHSDASQSNNMFTNHLFSPDVPLNSNDDILRALQALDLSKFAPLLKTLGEAAAQMPSTTPPYSPPAPTVGYGHPGPSNGNSYPSGSIYPNESMVRKPVNPPINSNHATILATKWLNPSKLAEMAKEEGLVFKKGKFSTVEEDAIRAAMEAYRMSKNLTDSDINDIIFAKGKKIKEQYSTFWSDLAMSVPQRPLTAVYHYVRRAYHPLKGQGKWSETEDQALNAAVAQYGQAWERVSAAVGRMAGDCRDRYRNHLVHREARNTGSWSKEEEEELTRIVLEMTVRQGKSADSEVFWGVVSEKMGNKRGRQQVRIKWTDGLSKMHKNDGHNPRWGQQDAYILVQKIAALDITHDSEIDWKQLSDKDWNLWSAHTLQRRWQTLKRGIKGSEEMSVAELVSILKEKKGQPPHALGILDKGKRRPTSQETVDESSEEEDDYGKDNSYHSGKPSENQMEKKVSKRNSQKGKSVEQRSDS